MAQKRMADRRGLREGGFTLIELMIVTAIIGLLLSIAMPKLADLLQKSQEGTLRGNLGVMRSVLSIYYADNQGTNITCALGPNAPELAAALVPRYVAAIPKVQSGLHPPTNSVYCDATMVSGSIHDGAGWYYDGTVPADSLAGGVWVACDHTDGAGSTWTTY